MAKGRVRLGSKNFFTLVVLSVSVLSLMFVTYASQQRTSTQSDAAGNSQLAISVRKDSNDNGKYDNDTCYVGANVITVGADERITYTTTSGGGCGKQVSLSGPTNIKLNAPNPSQLSYIYVSDVNGSKTYTNNISSGNIGVNPGNGNAMVVFGIKDSGPAAAAPKPPTQNNTNCDNWSWTYRGSSGAAKSVEYSLALNNKCNKDQRFKVEVDILTSDNRQATGWTYRFANGDLNSPITKTVDGNDSSGTKVTVSRANAKVAKGSSTYKVRVIATPCKNNNCNNLDTGNRVTYTTSYNVDN